MVFANVAVAGFFIVVSIIVLVSFPLTLLAAYCVIEAFLFGSRKAQLVSCVWFAIASSILAFGVRALWPLLDFDDDSIRVIALALGVPLCLGIIGFLYLLSRRVAQLKERRKVNLRQPQGLSNVE